MGPGRNINIHMPDSTIKTGINLAPQYPDLYRELPVLRDAEDGAPEQDDRSDGSIARLKDEAFDAIGCIRCPVFRNDRTSADKASLIPLLAIGFTGGVRAGEAAGERAFFDHAQATSSTSSAIVLARIEF